MADGSVVERPWENWAALGDRRWNLPLDADGIKAIGVVLGTPTAPTPTTSAPATTAVLQKNLPKLLDLSTEHRHSVYSSGGF